MTACCRRRALRGAIRNGRVAWRPSSIRVRLARWRQTDRCVRGETMQRKIIGALLLCVAQLAVCPAAQAFPDRPVKMGAALGQPVVVENRPGGAGGTIGAKSVIAAEPDGHTLMMGSTSAVLIAPLIVKSAGYRFDTFTPVAGLSETTEILAINPSV